MKFRFLLPLLLCITISHVSGMGKENKENQEPKNPKFMAKTIENFLISFFRVHQTAAGTITQKLAPLINKSQYHPILLDFIEKSNDIQPVWDAKIPALAYHDDDPLVAAPECHTLLFKNSHVRILWEVVKPGQTTAMHRHYWKSIMLIVQGSRFETINADGSHEDDNWPAGAYLLSADSQASAYKNIGSDEFRMLRIEIIDYITNLELKDAVENLFKNLIELKPQTFQYTGEEAQQNIQKGEYGFISQLF